MSTTTVQQNIIYGLGEGTSVANATLLTYALRWANAAYNKVIKNPQGYHFKSIRTRTIFRTTLGQQTYQAPSDFGGFIHLKDVSNGSILDQITPERFEREVDPNKVTDESFTSDFDVAVSLDNEAIVQYSETVTTTDGTTTYTRDTDYSMDYVAGTITVDSTGSMSDATEYYIDYLYYTQGIPNKFCIEYDATNAKYVFRIDPVPDAIYIASLIYPAFPSALSGAVDAIWSHFEFCLERGGIYFGSLEVIQDPQLRSEFRQEFNDALAGLISLDTNMVPKHDRIPLVLRKSDYTNRSIRPIENAGP